MFLVAHQVHGAVNVYLRVDGYVVVNVHASAALRCAALNPSLSFVHA